MKNKKNQINISYPPGLISKIADFPPNQVIPCSVLIYKKEICGLLIVCSSETMEYFKITPQQPPEPPINFRMLNYEKKIFAIEICMLFDENTEKYLKMYLNPHNKYVQRFLKLGSNTNMISFHFYNTESKLLSSAITKFHNEEKKWFVRNYILASKLIPDKSGYKFLAEYLYNDVTDRDRVFKFFNKCNSDFFVKEDGAQVMLRNISK